MKQILTYLTIVSIILIGGYAIGEDITRPPLKAMGRSDLFIVGQAFPLFYVGATTVASATAGTTAWLQISYSFADTTSKAEKISYRELGWQDPAYFGIDITYGGADSAGVDSAYFECAWDTTATPIWNGDFSNYFIATGAYDSTLYGISIYNPLSLSATTKAERGYNYKLAIQRGGYVRFIFSTPSDIADATIFNWVFWCKH
jgi:hypothetical protein